MNPVEEKGRKEEYQMTMEICGKLKKQHIKGTVETVDLRGSNSLKTF